MNWKIHNRIWEAAQKYASGTKPKRPEFVLLGRKLYVEFRREAAKKMPHQWTSIAGLPVYEDRSKLDGIEVRGGFA